MNTDSIRQQGQSFDNESKQILIPPPPIATPIATANIQHSRPDIQQQKQQPQINYKKLPSRFIDCPKDELLIIISRMLSSLIKINDQQTNVNLDYLNHQNLTRFHSRSPPQISLFSYLSRLSHYSSLENSALITSIYYIDLLSLCYPIFAVNSLTVHRFLLTSTTIASKALCDAFCSNSHYAKVGGVNVMELNLLEVEFLNKVNYRVIPRDFNYDSLKERERKSSTGALDIDYFKKIKLGVGSAAEVLDLYYKRMIILVGGKKSSENEIDENKVLIGCNDDVVYYIDEEKEEEKSGVLIGSRDSGNNVEATQDFRQQQESLLQQKQQQRQLRKEERMGDDEGDQDDEDDDLILSTSDELFSSSDDDDIDDNEMDGNNADRQIRQLEYDQRQDNNNSNSYDNNTTGEINNKSNDEDAKSTVKLLGNNILIPPPPNFKPKETPVKQSSLSFCNLSSTIETNNNNKFDYAAEINNSNNNETVTNDFTNTSNNNNAANGLNNKVFTNAMLPNTTSNNHSNSANNDNTDDGSVSSSSTSSLITNKKRTAELNDEFLRTEEPLSPYMAKKKMT